MGNTEGSLINNSKLKKFNLLLLLYTKNPKALKKA